MTSDRKSYIEYKNVGKHKSGRYSEIQQESEMKVKIKTKSKCVNNIKYENDITEKTTATDKNNMN